MNGDISTAFPKAVAMNDWLTKQQALVGGKLPIYDARHNIDEVTAQLAELDHVPTPTRPRRTTSRRST